MLLLLLWVVVLLCRCGTTHPASFSSRRGECYAIAVQGCGGSEGGRGDKAMDSGRRGARGARAGYDGGQHGGGGSVFVVDGNSC